MIHYISAAAGPFLRRLADEFELVWATGWEETANDYLPLLLELSGELPVLTFDGRVAAGVGPLEDRCDGANMPANPARSPGSTTASTTTCREWARRHPAPTLLIETASEQGMAEEHVEELLAWARALRSQP